MVLPDFGPGLSDRLGRRCRRGNLGAGGSEFAGNRDGRRCRFDGDVDFH